MTYTHIQALRGLLCIGVAVIHVKIYLLRQGEPSFFIHVPDILGGIPCAFFAVSGYFMAFLVDRNSPNFLVQRLVRVYPMYVIVIALSFLLRLFTDNQMRLDDLPQVLSLLPLGTGHNYKLGIEWTLLYEIWYYFLCAIFCRKGWTRYFPAFLLAWLFACIFMNTVSFYPPPMLPNVLNIWFSVWNVSFILGALVYYFMQRSSEATTYMWTGYVLLGMAAVSCALIAKMYTVLYVLSGVAVALLWGLIKLEKYCSSPKLLVQYGDYSYTLYLLHTNVILVTFDRWSAFTGTKPGPITGLIALVLCIGGAWFLGQVDVNVHARLRKWVSAKLKPKPVPVPVRAES